MTPGITEIPVIETERLILRGPRPEDFDDFAAMRASPRMATVGGPFDRLEAWGQFSQHFGHWAIRGYGRWFVTARDTGDLLGVVGLFYPEGWPEPELAWSMADAAEGKGYAHEAAIAARRYAYEVMDWTRLISAVDPANTRSVALATRLGCTRTDPFDHPKYGLLHLWLHPGPEDL